MGDEFEALSGRILEAAVAMEVALRHRDIPFDNQKDNHIFFEDVEVGLHRLDLIVDGQIIVELKAVKASRIPITRNSSPT